MEDNNEQNDDQGEGVLREFRENENNENPVQAEQDENEEGNNNNMVEMDLEDEEEDGDNDSTFEGGVARNADATGEPKKRSTECDLVSRTIWLCRNQYNSYVRGFERNFDWETNDPYHFFHSSSLDDAAQQQPNT